MDQYGHLQYFSSAPYTVAEMTMCAEDVAVFKLTLYNAEGGGATDNLMKENISHKSRVDHMDN